MAIFVDTGVLVAHQSPSDKHHARALELVRSIQDGQYGNAFTSDYVFGEAINLAMARGGKPAVVRGVGELVLPERAEERWVALLHVLPEEFKRAWIAVRRFEKARLSFTDWTIVEVMRGRGIAIAASFDSGLDGWVTRVE